MKKKIVAALSGVLMLLSAPAMAVQLTQAGVNVIDRMVAGVYRPTVGTGDLTYIKRERDLIYLLQGEDVIAFEIDDILFAMDGSKQVLHMLDGNQELITLDKTYGNAVMTFSSGEAIYFSRVRGLTRHDLAKVKPRISDYSGSGSTSAVVASFPCEKAGTKVEKIICSMQEIADLDIEMSKKYKTVMSMADGEDKAFHRKAQRTWVKERNSCNDAMCVAKSYIGQLEQLNLVINYLNKPAEYR